MRAACAPRSGSLREVPPAGCGVGVGGPRRRDTAGDVSARVLGLVAADVRVRVAAPALSDPCLGP